MPSNSGSSETIFGLGISIFALSSVADAIGIGYMPYAKAASPARPAEPKVLPLTRAGLFALRGEERELDIHGCNRAEMRP